MESGLKGCVGGTESHACVYAQLCISTPNHSLCSPSLLCVSKTSLSSRYLWTGTCGWILHLPAWILKNTDLRNRLTLFPGRRFYIERSVIAMNSTDKKRYYMHMDTQGHVNTSLPLWSFFSFSSNLSSVYLLPLSYNDTC